MSCYRQSKEDGKVEEVQEDEWRKRAEQVTIDPELAWNAGNFQTPGFLYFRL